MHYLLLKRHAILLLKAFALADQVTLLGEDGGGHGHFVGGATLAAAAPHRPHLLLVAADAVRTAQGTSLVLVLIPENVQPPDHSYTFAFRSSKELQHSFCCTASFCGAGMPSFGIFMDNEGQKSR